jgi:tetratricopeptide (TPR) repeat protein
VRYPSSIDRGRRRIAAACLGLATALALAAVAVAQQPRPGTEARIEHGIPEPSATESPGAPGIGTGGGMEGASNAYRSALSSLAGGSPSTAVAAITALESQLAADPATPQRESPLRAELAVLEQLAARDPEALLPVVLLHYNLFTADVARHRLDGAAHHAGLVERTAGLYAERAATPEARRSAATMLAALGVELSGINFRADAARVLGEALELQPDDPSTLLALAAERERTTAYGEAVRLLERLVAAAPSSVEGRLRLAVNLLRTGREGEAVERLTALVRDPEAGWAAEIAYQELARLRLDRGDPAGAAELLRRAAERFPESETVQIQLALALERGGDPAAARALAERLAARPAGGGETPRRRYNHGAGTGGALEAVAALEGAAHQRRAALAAALEALAAEETGG